MYYTWEKKKQKGPRVTYSTKDAHDNENKLKDISAYVV